MTTITLFSGKPDTQTVRNFYDWRRNLSPVIASVRHVLETEVYDKRKLALLNSEVGKRRLLLDAMAIPHPNDRENYFREWHLEYCLSGLEDS